MSHKDEMVLESSTTPLYQSIGDDLNLGTLHHTEVIQSLWSGYGELVRLTFDQRPVILKHVQLPTDAKHPRGWDTDHAHQRKIHSYHVEVCWYDTFSTPVDARCPFPQGLHGYKKQDAWLIVMEDLAAAGFPHVIENADTTHLRAALHWLANFHARYMGRSSPLLWKQGTYWHLKTRPNELDALKDLPLKTHAQAIDEALHHAPYPTIIHGDAKLANFCFSADGTRTAAVDFQYVGQGCGMQDVAYFMSSAIAPEDCEAMEVWVLDTYFEALHNALNHYQPHLNPEDVEQTWRPLFAIAWADFQRFLKGWHPTHYKINPYTEALTKRGLAQLKVL